MRFPFSCTCKPDFSSVFGGLAFLGCVFFLCLLTLNPGGTSCGRTVGRLQSCSAPQQDKLKQNIS